MDRLHYRPEISYEPKPEGFEYDPSISAPEFLEPGPYYTEYDHYFQLRTAHIWGRLLELLLNTRALMEDIGQHMQDRPTRIDNKAVLGILEYIKSKVGDSAPQGYMSFVTYRYVYSAKHEDAIRLKEAYERIHEGIGDIDNIHVGDGWDKVDYDTGYFKSGSLGANIYPVIFHLENEINELCSLFKDTVVNSVNPELNHESSDDTITEFINDVITPREDSRLEHIKRLELDLESADDDVAIDHRIDIHEFIEEDKHRYQINDLVGNRVHLLEQSFNQLKHLWRFGADLRNSYRDMLRNLANPAYMIQHIRNIMELAEFVASRKFLDIRNNIDEVRNRIIPQRVTSAMLTAMSHFGLRVVSPTVCSLMRETQVHMSDEMDMNQINIERPMHEIAHILARGVYSSMHSHRDALLGSYGMTKSCTSNRAGAIQDIQEVEQARAVRSCARRVCPWIESTTKDTNPADELD